MARWSARIPVTVRWGVLLAFATALISGFSVYLNGFAVKQLPDSAVYTTLKNGVAAIILVAIAAMAVRPAEIRSIPRRSWGTLVLIGIVGGSIPFLLFFAGLAQASAPSAAFIQKTLFIWVAFAAVPLLGERIGLAQLGALAVLLVGQVLVTPPNGVKWGQGETMIAAATLFWAVEVILAKRLLNGTVPSQVLGAARLGFGMVVLVGYLAITGKLGTIAALNATQWAWALGTGAVLSAYVTFWFAALRRAPATTVSAILVVAAPVTALIQALAAGTVPAPQVLAGQVIVAVAAIALTTLVVRGTTRRPAATTTTA